MILIAALILSLQILSKANSTDILPSCAIECLHEAARGKGCALGDSDCLCDVSFGFATTVKDSGLICIRKTCHDADIDRIADYLVPRCAIFSDIEPSEISHVELAAKPLVARQPDIDIGDEVNELLESVTSTPATKPQRTSNQEDGGLSLGGKIAVGVLVPLAVIGMIFGLLAYLKARKRKQNAPQLPPRDIEGDAEGTGKAELAGAGIVTHPAGYVAEDKAELGGDGRDGAKPVLGASELGEDSTRTLSPHYDESKHGNRGSYVGSNAELDGSIQRVELSGSGAHSTGHNVELDGSSSQEIHELNPTGSSPVTAAAAPHDNNNRSGASSPQTNIARALGGTSQREESMNRALGGSLGAPEMSASTQSLSLSGPIPSASELYPPNAASDDAALVEEEKRLVAKRAKIAEMRRLAEEEEVLEREEEALRRRKAGRGGS